MVKLIAATSRFSWPLHRSFT